MPQLSIVIPTFNEMKHGFLERQSYQQDGIELIYVDGGSSDGTLEYLHDQKVVLIESTTSSRGERLNLGIEAATSTVVLLHHPRTIVDQEGVSWLIDNYDNVGWGGFTHRFNFSHPLLRWTSWYSNHVRADLKDIFYLDHCIFARKGLLQKAGKIPAVDIFEDTLLSLQLAEIAKPMRLPFYSTTSAIRFQENGVWQQILLNQFIKIGYWLGVPHQQMNRLYEKGLELNSSYLKGKKNEKSDR